MDTQPDPLTWIIYQGHLSTVCPTSPTHASTKHVPISPTYHHNICVSTIYQRMYQTINLYPNKHQPCTTTCTTTSASTMHQHPYHVPQLSTMYINTIPSINPVPYHVSTMYIDNVHKHPCHTMYINLYTIPCINHVHQHMYHTMYQECISTICHFT
jgi:hypothetical protein